MGVFTCGSTALASTCSEEKNSTTNLKLADNKFTAINGLKDVKITSVACGDYHTTCISE